MSEEILRGLTAAGVLINVLIVEGLKKDMESMLGNRIIQLGMGKCVN